MFSKWMLIINNNESALAWCISCHFSQTQCSCPLSCLLPKHPVRVCLILESCSRSLLVYPGKIDPHRFISLLPACAEFLCLEWVRWTNNLDKWPALTQIEFLDRDVCPDESVLRSECAPGTSRLLFLPWDRLIFIPWIWPPVVSPDISNEWSQLSA